MASAALEREKSEEPEGSSIGSGEAKLRRH